MLNTISETYFRLHHSRWFALGAVAVFVACALLIAGARPAETQNLYNVSALQADSNISTLLNRYVQVSGKLDSTQSYQIQTDVVGLQVRGTHFVPLLIDGRDEPLIVLDQDIPSANADGRVQLTGLIRGRADGADQYPAYYLEVDKPANIPLNNRLAQFGLGLGALILLVVLGGWLVKRANYALGSGVATMDYKGPLLWWGTLGSQFLNAWARHEPVQIGNTKNSRLNLAATNTLSQWGIIMERVLATQPSVISTTQGNLPGVRVNFEDERGLVRRGVIAGSNHDIAALTEHLGRLSQQSIKHKNR